MKKNNISQDEVVLETKSVKVSYPVRSFRMSDKTYFRLKDIKEIKQRSWNLIFMDCLEAIVKDSRFNNAG